MASFSNSMDIVRWFGLLALTVLVVVQGLEDIYLNSHISPHSSSEDAEDVRSQIPTDHITSGPMEIKSSISKRDSMIDGSGNIVNAPHVRIERSANPILSKTNSHTHDDLLATSKNVAETLDHNDVELSARTLAHTINPTKTYQKESEHLNVPQTNIKHSGQGSGEGRGAPPQARSISLTEPQDLAPSAMTTPVNFATQSPPPLGRPRQANPDIQDIITGIVKLLNGNVNVQANTAPAMGGRPLRPQSTRINNRGPPRITDTPIVAQPDFDVAQPLPPPPAGQMTPPPSTTRQPTPYPFEKPPQSPNASPGRPFVSGVPPPDHIIPLNPLGGPPFNQRPGFHRPSMTIPPWNRPHPNRRPGPNRRPPMPPYKLPPFKPEETISLTSESPEDALNLHLGTEFDSEMQTTNSEPNEASVSAADNSTGDGLGNDIITTTSEPEQQPNEADIKESMDFEKNKEKSTSKMEKSKTTSSVTTTSTTAIYNSLIKPESSVSATTSGSSSASLAENPSSSKVNESVSGSTLAKTETDIITPSSTQGSLLAPSTVVEIVHLDNNTGTTGGSSSEGTVGEAIPVIETSIPEIINSLKDNGDGNVSQLTTIVNNNLPTEKLPELTPSSITGIVESVDLNKEHVSTQQNGVATTAGFSYHPYKPRPGIVLDDTEFKPGGVGRPIITARPPIGQIGEIFDVTVSAIQGPSGGGLGTPGKPYIIPVQVDHGGNGNGDVITSPTGEEGFVSIDGKRTYLNLFGEPTAPPTNPQHIAPTAVVSPPSITPTATGYAIPETERPVPHPKPTPPRRPLYGRPRPSQPPVRIDTCIVGDDSTCDATQHEVCRTEAGVSACHCRPGYARRKHRDPCRRVVSVLLSLRVDRLYERRVVWANELSDTASESYQQLSYETERAIDSAMSMTPFSDDFLSGKVNSIYKGDRTTGHNGVFVNLTLQLEENAETARPQVRADIQRHLLGVIQRRNNNVGNSALWVDSPPGSVSSLQDVDECSSADLHDCHTLARCVNIFGGFRCECHEGFRDPWVDNRHRSGRFCEQCSPAHCNNRGECKYDKTGQQVCVCAGNYYGAQCEVDGEVLGVAIGASVAAIIIIGLTLVCLVMWSRRWSREQKGAVGSPVFGYMATAGNTVKTPPVGGPPYQVSLEDRLRWAQIADVMAQANHYAPEPVMTGPTRPSSAMFGYPTLSIAGTLQHGASLHGTLPPIPLPRLGLQAHLAGRAASIHGMRPLDNSSSSEEEDRADLLGRNFQVPRPKSRSNASVANQSGIYYDVDYDQNDIYKQGGTIPMSTYTIGRPPYYRT